MISLTNEKNLYVFQGKKVIIISYTIVKFNESRIEMTVKTLNNEMGARNVHLDGIGTWRYIIGEDSCGVTFQKKDLVGWEGEKVGRILSAALKAVVLIAVVNWLEKHVE